MTWVSARYITYGIYDRAELYGENSRAFQICQIYTGSEHVTDKGIWCAPGLRCIQVPEELDEIEASFYSAQ